MSGEIFMVFLNLLTALTPLPAVLVSVWSYRATHDYQNKTLEQNRDFEESRRDAKLKSSSRIKWIEDVRNATARFIENYDLLADELNPGVEGELTPFEKSRYDKVSRQVINSETVLELFFPYDIKDKDLTSITLEKAMSQIINSKSNKGLNVYMVVLFKEVRLYSESIIRKLTNDYIVLDDIKSEINELPSTYRDDIVYAISKYLKIEWDIAKNGR